MSENYIININQLVQEVEKIENILTNRDLYSIGLMFKPPRTQRGRGTYFNFYTKLINDIGENIYNIYYPRSTESASFGKLLETKIAINIGTEEYNFYKIAAEEDERGFIEGSRSQDGDLSYSDLVKLNAYIELFHSISGRAKDLIRFMITDNIEEALDISTAIESLCIVGINKSLIEIENLHREAKELINNGICENFKDAFAILLDINIDNLIEDKIQNSIVSPKDRILELEKNNSNLITGHSNTGKRALKLNINRYLREGKFENLSEIYDLCIDPIIDSRYKNNPFKEIFKRLDQGEKLMESDIERFKNNIKSSLRNFNANSIRGRILKKFSKPELVDIFNRLADDRFKNLGNFIINELNKNLKEISSEEEREYAEIPQIRNEEEIQRIREEQLRRIREQQLAVAQLNIEIHTDENDQEIDISYFEEMVQRNLRLPITAIYQTCISGAIMFLVDKDPLEELFTEIDKIIINEQNTNKRKNEISNKIKELKDEINNFLIQIEKDDRKKLKIYLSNPIVKDIFDRKSNNLYSNLILNPIINMIAKIEKETNNKCCIY